MEFLDTFKLGFRYEHLKWLGIPTVTKSQNSFLCLYSLSSSYTTARVSNISKPSNNKMSWLHISMKNKGAELVVLNNGHNIAHYVSALSWNCQEHQLTIFLSLVALNYTVSHFQAIQVHLASLYCTSICTRCFNTSR